MKKLLQYSKIALFGLEALLFPIIDFIYLLTYLVPKQKNKFIFGSSLGQKYCDNSRYLFEYIYKNQKSHKNMPKINAIWITKNRNIVKKLRDQGYKCHYYLSIKGLWHTLSAQRIYVTHYKTDINRLLINTRTQVINLWHGIPLKKIEYDQNLSLKNKPIYRFLINYIIFPYRNKTDLLPVSSKYIQARFISSFRLNEEKTPILGSPREDVLIKHKNKTSDKTQIKNILYAPTHRRGNGTLLVMPSKDQIKQLDLFLKKHQAVLSIRLHMFDKIHLGKLGYLIDSAKNIKLDSFTDMQESLIQTDVLITDYSSSFFDYLLLEKPIIFHSPDIKEYLTKNHEHYDSDYDKVTPGPKTKTWSEVIRELENFFNNKDKYQESRIELKKKIFKYTDGKNCARILDYHLPRTNLL